MIKFGKRVVKLRVPILIVCLLLLIPSVFGMINTRINYDMLDYLPENMDTVITSYSIHYTKLYDFTRLCSRRLVSPSGDTRTQTPSVSSALISMTHLPTPPEAKNRK